MMNFSKQLSLLGDQMDLSELVQEPGADYGEVFTRRWVVEFLLDLAGYTPDRDLGSLVMVEPSCGTGAFLLPIVDRLIESAARHGQPLRSLGGAIRAIDLLEANAERARKAVALRLHEAGLELGVAEEIAGEWVTTGDFLLSGSFVTSADFVVGNPPYIRLESIPRRTMEQYRRVCSTMRGRSDIYVGFIQRGLELLNDDGRLAFICADRWMRNQYGADLRELVANFYAVDAVITMHEVDAFDDDVSAYPAVTVVRRGQQHDSVVAETTGNFGSDDAAELSSWVGRSRSKSMNTATFEASRLESWNRGKDLWPSGSPARLSMLADLEARFPPLQDSRTGTRVGIGIATGCDDVFMTTDSQLVEPSRLLPLLQASDTSTGRPDWSGTFLVNPWDDNGLVAPEQFPKLSEYLTSHEIRLRRRHVARRTARQWYRTIDRVDPLLLDRPKLVLPDLKASAHPVLDEGHFYPHHNLYFVCSDSWNLEVLGGLLLSQVANLFVGAYCVKMRGGCFRFQAQYIRRIRVPHLGSVTKRDERALSAAFISRDVEAATAAALRLYSLDALPGSR